ncbi:MAG: MgtC/SapB family protein, partial [Bdellovibrionales bacterium]|nr:MgtC/SapB family protein [Bdellovibrionales bacterium]
HELHGIFGIELDEILGQIARLGIALFLALIIGWNRERDERSAGMRTFPLVAVSSCAYVMLAITAFGYKATALARVLEGLMTGIGFIGGGAILKNSKSVRGTATAASIWNTAAIGAAVALRRYDFAIALTLLNFLILNLIPPIKKVVAKN